jgi:hypothetical protein
MSRQGNQRFYDLVVAYCWFDATTVVISYPRTVEPWSAAREKVLKKGIVVP